MFFFARQEAKRDNKIQSKDQKASNHVFPLDDCQDSINRKKTMIYAEGSKVSRLNDEEAARKQLEEIKNKLSTSGNPPIKDWVIGLILFVIFIAEIALMAPVLSIFGEVRLMTYIMASGIGLAIPIGAHCVCKVIRWEIKSGKDIALAAMIILSVFITIIGIAIIRADYLSYIFSSYNTNIKITAKTAAAIFISINLFLFFLVSFISYLGRHKNDEGYKKLKFQLKWPY